MWLWFSGCDLWLLFILFIYGVVHVYEWILCFLVCVWVCVFVYLTDTHWGEVSISFYLSKCICVFGHKT